MKQELQIAFQNVGVNLSDTVDGMRSDDSKVSHVDTLALVLFNQGHAAEAIIFSGEMLGHILDCVQIVAILCHTQLL